MWYLFAPPTHATVTVYVVVADDGFSTTVIALADCMATLVPSSETPTTNEDEDPVNVNDGVEGQFPELESFSKILLLNVTITSPFSEILAPLGHSLSDAASEIE